MRYGRNTLDIAEAFGVPESVVWNILAASDGAP
jgi:hypothetical protein